MKARRGQVVRLAAAALAAVVALGSMAPVDALAAAPVTVDFTVASRPYDGTKNATVTGCSLTGVVDPHVVTCDFSTAVATFLDPDVGTAKAVSASGFVLGGADAGEYSISAVNTSSADITPGSQTIAFGLLADKSLADPPFSLSASASSGLAVAFSTKSAACSVTTAGTVTLLAVGTCTIAADQAGAANWTAAPQVTQSFAVGVALGSQTITFTSTAPSTASVGGATYTVTATGGGSGNPVTFTIDAAASAVCSISLAVVSFLAVGTCTINANQAGNGTTWAAAPQVTQSFTVGAVIVPPPVGLPTLTVTADAKSRPFGQANAQLTATISGFVNGQTLATSGVTGSPACVTTATITSPAGSYPITCGIGTLASASYGFVFAPGVLAVVRGVSSVTLSTATTVFETSTPATFTATVEPSVAGAIPSGSLAFTIDGVARPAVPLDALGRGSVTVTWTTVGVKSVEVAYTGDGSVAEPGTRPRPRRSPPTRPGPVASACWDPRSIRSWIAGGTR